MSPDWLDELENDIVDMDVGDEGETRAHIVEKLMNMFFGLWLKFDLERGVRMQLTPFEWEFVEYKGKQEWQVNMDFNFSRATEVELLDAHFSYDQGLRAELYKAGSSSRLRVVFMLADRREGERTIMTPYLLYDSPASSARISDIWNDVKPVVILWHQAHISGDQEMLWDAIKANYVELPGR